MTRERHLEASADRSQDEWGPSAIAFGILSDRFDAGGPAIGAGSFDEFRASTKIIEEAPPMKLEARVDPHADGTDWRKAHRKFPYESFATNENRSDHLSLAPSSSLSVTELPIWLAGRSLVPFVSVLPGPPPYGYWVGFCTLFEGT